eukprot:1554551-Prymnesium_polylepis.1
MCIRDSTCYNGTVHIWGRESARERRESRERHTAARKKVRACGGLRVRVWRVERRCPILHNHLLDIVVERTRYKVTESTAVEHRARAAMCSTRARGAQPVCSPRGHTARVPLSCVAPASRAGASLA